MAIWFCCFWAVRTQNMMAKSTEEERSSPLHDREAVSDQYQIERAFSQQREWERVREILQRSHRKEPGSSYTFTRQVHSSPALTVLSAADCQFEFRLYQLTETEFAQVNALPFHCVCKHLKGRVWCELYQSPSPA